MERWDSGWGIFKNALQREETRMGRGIAIHSGKYFIEYNGYHKVSAYNTGFMKIEVVPF